MQAVAMAVVLCSDARPRSIAREQLVATDDTAAEVATSVALVLAKLIDRASENDRSARDGNRLEKWTHMG